MFRTREEKKTVMTVEEFELFVRKLARCLETVSPEESSAKLKEFGLDYNVFGFQPHFSEEHQIWEAPQITEHNKKCGTRGILSAGFYTLYAKRSQGSYKSSVTGDVNYHYGYIQFTRGRIGNTVSLEMEVTIAE